MSKGQMLSTFSSDALGSMDGVALSEKIVKGEISTLEVVKAAIARAQLINPHINAIATETFDLAIRQAGKTVSGGFAGVPAFIKDNEDFSGAPTLYGSRSVIGVKKRKSAVFIRQYLSTYIEG
jgi:amidase